MNSDRGIKTKIRASSCTGLMLPSSPNIGQSWEDTVTKARITLYSTVSSAPVNARRNRENIKKIRKRVLNDISSFSLAVISLFLLAIVNAQSTKAINVISHAAVDNTCSAHSNGDAAQR